MAKHSPCHRLNAQQFCRARPVRAPKAEHWRIAWPSASKNGAATGTVRERIALSLTFHTQWLVKGSCFRNKPFTCDSFAFDDERLGDFRKAFSHRACGRQPLWKRLAMCEAIHQLGCAHGARTAKLLRTSQRPSQCKTICGRAARGEGGAGRASRPIPPRAGPAAGEAGTSGIHNVFRYAFNVLTGDFARPHVMSDE